MKLDKETLTEMLEYVEKLNEEVGLSSETMLEVTQTINKKLDKLKKFPKFWFEGNHAFMWVNNIEDLKQVFKQYDEYMSADKVLDTAVNVDDELSNFGLRSEHQGNVTLRQFLKDNNIEI